VKEFAKPFVKTSSLHSHEKTVTRWIIDSGLAKW